MKRRIFAGVVFMMVFALVVGVSVCMPRNAEARHCAAIIYEHADYRGMHQCLQVGTYNLEDLELPNDSLSSIKVRKGTTVVLFQHKNFSGRKYFVHHNHSYIGDKWNDSVSSIVVE